MRAGMIGLDTSHVIEFTKIFHDESNRDLSEIEIVVGYPGGTEIPVSRDRIEDFTAQMRALGVTIVDSIPDLLEQVDVVFLESVDGNAHLQQAIPVFDAGKPVFIDKPIAGSLADAIVIAQLSKDHQISCFSSSCIRYCPKLNRLNGSSELGAINGAITWGPSKVQPNIPDLYFYGVHGVEGLFQLMGTGCLSVSRTHTAETDVVTGLWRGDRVGMFRGDRTGRTSFGATAFGNHDTATVDVTIAYRELCSQIAEFFRSGIAPVPLEETIEIFAFMEAADESKRFGGAVVKLADVLAKATSSAKATLRQL